MRIKIKQCSLQGAWYENIIGSEFEVLIRDMIAVGEYWGYAVYVVMQEEHKVLRKSYCVRVEDCSIIKEYEEEPLSDRMIKTIILRGGEKGE